MGFLGPVGEEGGGGLEHGGEVGAEVFGAEGGGEEAAGLGVGCQMGLRLKICEVM